MKLKPAVIVSAARTPTGNFGKTLSTIECPKLGAIAIREALKRSKIPPQRVDEVIFGVHFQQGIKANAARQAAVFAGLPYEVPAFTPNKNCGTALKAISLGAQSIMVGDNDVVIAGGAESMSRVPYILKDARFGYRMGPGQIYDGMLYDGLVDCFMDYHMGITAENVAKKHHISRERQDEFAVRSHNLAQAAWDKGLYDGDIVPVEIPQKKGEPIQFTVDETFRRDVKLEDFSKLKPVFLTDGTGTVTVANASPINDAAAAVVMTSEEYAKNEGIAPLARYVTTAIAAYDPALMGYTPVFAVQKLLKKTGLTLNEIGLIELNEAFAAQALACIDDLGLDIDKVNVNGGAIALGHPVGATGARLTMTLIHEMRRRGVQYGIVTLCIGGGQGIATLFENCG